MKKTPLFSALLILPVSILDSLIPPPESVDFLVRLKAISKLVAGELFGTTL